MGELTAAAGVTARTVRYYESIGLIPAGYREGTGQHRYTDETVARLNKIGQLKNLGLSLEEIAEVIDLYFEDPSGVEAKVSVLAILRKHLRETDAKIQDLGRFRNDLEANIVRFEQWLLERGVSSS
jgi:DNA-binding transcriptional MerR regulator